MTFILKHENDIKISNNEKKIDIQTTSKRKTDALLLLLIHGFDFEILTEEQFNLLLHTSR